MLKKLVSHSFVYGLGNQLPKVINFLMLPFLTPFLSPKDYGLFGILIAYITALTAFKALGTTVLLSNSFYKFKQGNRFKFVWDRIYGFLSLWSLFLSGIFALVVLLALPDSENVYLFYIVLAYSIPVALFDTTVLIGSKYLQYAQRPMAYSLITFIASVSGIVTNYVCIVEFKLGYLGWVASMFMVSMVSFFLYGYFLMFKSHIYPRFNFSFKWLKSKLVIALPVIPHFYSSYLITSSDRIILDQYNVSVDAIGLYNLAYTFGGYFAIIGQSMGLALGPILYKLFVAETEVSEKNARKLIFLLQAGMILLAFLTALWIKEVFQLMIKNESLQEGYVCSVILIMSYTYYPLYFAVNTKLQYLEKTKYLWRITFSSGLVNIALNLMLVPFWGIYATSFVTFLSLMYMAVAGYFVGNSELNSRLNYYPLRWIALTSALLLIVFFLKDITWPYKLAITVLVVIGITLFKMKKANPIYTFK